MTVDATAGHCSGQRHGFCAALYGIEQQPSTFGRPCPSVGHVTCIQKLEMQCTCITVFSLLVYIYTPCIYTIYILCFSSQSKMEVPGLPSRCVLRTGLPLVTVHQFANPVTLLARLASSLPERLSSYMCVPARAHETGGLARHYSGCKALGSTPEHHLTTEHCVMRGD